VAPSSAEIYLADVRREFARLKHLADAALARVSDEEFFRPLDPESNSLACLVKHLAGNNRSRWSDFLTTDGEKPDRRRDAEFEREPEDTRPALMARWEQGWRTLLDSLAALTPADLTKTVTIRGEPHTVVEAIDRALSHQAYHVGQIVFLAKHFRWSTWESLSVPRRRRDPAAAASDDEAQPSP
jgi:uncharacterized damage-inducible protein DinB